MKTTARFPTTESLARVEAARALKKGSRVHLSGICGTGMAAVAALLKDLGFKISGSDKAFYPPMGDVVRKITNELYEGYRAENLANQPDLVVVGNSLSLNNPELEAVLQKKLAYASMPEIFQALLIGTHEFCKTSVVITGTHGKTTTTAAAATMLDVAGRKPGFFIGGVPRELGVGLRGVDLRSAPKDRVVVLEGDEYDSACFAKWPKFHSYRPDILVVTSLEFDHADIYESVEQIEEQFTILATAMGADGTIVVCDQGERLQPLVQRWRKQKEIKAKILTYGEEQGSDFQLLSRKPLQDTVGQSMRLKLQDLELECKSSLTGVQNAYNLLSVAAVGKLVGLSAEQISEGIGKFTGVLRRQQELCRVNDIVVIEDFAHHPTAVALTLEGLRESNPGRRVVGVFEPRSNTSRRGFFQAEYEKSFGASDITVILEVKDAGGYSGTSQPVVALDVKKIVDAITASGKSAQAFTTTAEIKSFLLKNARPKDLIVFMSNGDFCGLMKEFVTELKAAYPA